MRVPIPKCVLDRIAGIDVHKKMLAVVVAEAAEPEKILAQRAWGATNSKG